jgi:hypothetical protein
MTADVQGGVLEKGLCMGQVNLLTTVLTAC